MESPPIQIFGDYTLLREAGEIPPPKAILDTSNILSPSPLSHFFKKVILNKSIILTGWLYEAEALRAHVLQQFLLLFFCISYNYFSSAIFLSHPIFLFQTSVQKPTLDVDFY